MSAGVIEAPPPMVVIPIRETAAHQFTASATDRFLHCGWWARPEVPHAHSTSAAGERGEALHAVAEYTLRVCAGESPKMVPAEWLHTHEADYIVGTLRAWSHRVRAAGGQVFVEYGVARDLTTGAWREVPRAMGRAYHCSATEIAGRIDWAVWYPDARRLELWDLKTGSRAPTPTCGQMLTNAVLMSHLQPERVVSCIMHVPSTDKGVPRARDADLDLWELDAHAERLKRRLALIPDAEPCRGPGCHFCPAKGICPEFGGGGVP